MKRIILPLIAVTIIGSLANASDTRSTTAYIALLHRVANNFDYKMDTPMRHCIEKAAGKTPEIIKQLSIKYKSIDAESLRRNGATEKDIQDAMNAGYPCIMIASKQ